MIRIYSYINTFYLYVSKLFFFSSYNLSIKEQARACNYISNNNYLLLKKNPLKKKKRTHDYK